MNPELLQLHPYPFEKLAALKSSVTPANLKHIAFSIGEPKHQSPAFVAQAISDNIAGLGIYPSTKGMPELSQCIADWCQNRFKLPAGSLDPAVNVVPVNGTREAIFSFVQAVVERRDDALVVCPNPFYQIYEGAAYLAGAKPHYLNLPGGKQFYRRLRCGSRSYLAALPAIIHLLTGQPNRGCHRLIDTQETNPTGR